MLAGKYGEGSDDEKTQPYLTQELTFGQAYAHSKTSQNILKTYSGKLWSNLIRQPKTAVKENVINLPSVNCLAREVRSRG